MNSVRPSSDPDELLYPSQVLELLGLSRTARATLRRAVREGKLVPSIETPGGHSRYRRADVLRYRDELRARATRGNRAPPAPPPEP